MVCGKILEELKRLTSPERLAAVETALRLIRNDLRSTEPPQVSKTRKHELTAAAKALLSDYQAGGELTVFATLGSEDFGTEGGDLANKPRPNGRC